MKVTTLRRRLPHSEESYHTQKKVATLRRKLPHSEEGCQPNGCLTQSHYTDKIPPPLSTLTSPPPDPLPRHQTPGKSSASHRDYSTGFSGPRRLVGLVVKASRTEDPEFDSSLRRGRFSGPRHTSDSKTGTQMATMATQPDVIGSALGLAGPVSVYCDWVK